MFIRSTGKRRKRVAPGEYRICSGSGSYVPNRSAARALALAASSSRFFGGAVVSSDRRSRVETPATSSIAARNKASLAFDGLLKPVIFLTNCSDAARISSALTGGSKLKRVLMFLHIQNDLRRVGVNIPGGKVRSLRGRSPHVYGLCAARLK